MWNCDSTIAFRTLVPRVWQPKLTNGIHARRLYYYIAKTHDIISRTFYSKFVFASFSLAWRVNNRRARKLIFWPETAQDYILCNLNLLTNNNNNITKGENSLSNLLSTRFFRCIVLRTPSRHRRPSRLLYSQGEHPWETNHRNFKYKIDFEFWSYKASHSTRMRVLYIFYLMKIL